MTKPSAWALFPAVLRGVRACMYNSPEERALLQAVAGTDEVPGVVVGIGSEVPASAQPARFRQRTGLQARTAIYIGRIDENKGCARTLRLLEALQRNHARRSHAGAGRHAGAARADHPRIRHLGFVSDQDKYDALAAAEFLIMPSYLESLSMVALEAWALGKPVLANGKCDVLRGQAMRSNAGLYYENYAEFVEAVRVLESSATVAATLGRNGSSFFRANYAWPVIERKFLDMFDRLTRQTGDPARAHGAAARLVGTPAEDAAAGARGARGAAVGPRDAVTDQPLRRAGSHAGPASAAGPTTPDGRAGRPPEVHGRDAGRGTPTSVTAVRDDGQRDGARP